ncbi:MAG: transposase [Magnetococcales bacterium]|nr:transposase [Magnetococcales bacterium]
MIEVADIFRQFGCAYIAAYGDSMLPSHRVVISDVIRCRTEVMGGHLYRCDTCDHPIYSYHSCKNRHCPKCHSEQTRRWQEQRQGELLPVPYFHVTITVPESLRSLFRSNQNDLYNLFMKTCAEAILELAKDPRHIGGLVGILMVLHTWNQQLLNHPHVHCLVPGGGVADDGTWHPAPNGFLFPVQALSVLVRGKFMSALKRLRPDLDLPESAWQQQWVSHCTPWGVGEQAVLDYLARYVFRIAITNCRVVAMDENSVTFRYKERKKRRWRTCQVSGMEFMRRFLQHVLPQGFHKVRYYGLWNPQNRPLAHRVRLGLLSEPPSFMNQPPSVQSTQESCIPARRVEPGAPCPHCGVGKLILVQTIPRPASRSP